MGGSRICGRCRIVGLIATGLALITPAAAQASWEKLSPDDVSITSEVALWRSSGLPPPFAAAWPATPADDSVPTSIELRTFAPTLVDPAGTVGPTSTPVSGWNALGDSVAFAPAYAPADYAAALNDSHLLFTGFSHDGDGDGGTFLTGPLQLDSTALPYAKLAPARGGDLDTATAYSGPNLRLLWANNFAGALSTYQEDTAPTPREPDLQAQLGGCCAYHPTLGAESDGKVWLAWYSNAAANKGLYMVPLDGATAAALGPAVKVPGSESVANNYERLPLVCLSTCRIFYATQASPSATRVKLASWAPGDSAPTKIAGVDDLTLNGVVAASAAFGVPSNSLDGDTWVAWFDRGAKGSKPGYRFTYGDARGAGGKTIEIGKPPGSQAFGQLIASVPSWNGLLLLAVAGPGGARGGAVWAELTTPEGDPGIADTNGVGKPAIARAGTAIAVVPGRPSATSLGHHGLLVGLQSTIEGKVKLELCLDRPGHPPSPCDQESTRFRAPGFDSIHYPPGPPVLPPGPPVRGSSLKLTLRAGGERDSVTLKFAR